MNAFEYTDKIWDIFVNDPMLLDLLEVDTRNEESYAKKIRQEDFMPEEFDASSLDFIAFYFADAEMTVNDFLNNGILRFDIYSNIRDRVVPIRERIVTLMHENFDTRVRAEGQRSSGITNVYKYRLEFKPLIFT